MTCSIIQKATLDDLTEIRNFTDYWLAGRGKAKGAPGAVNDYFISPGQHMKYIRKYKVYLVKEHNKIVAWAVVQHGDSLIHLLVAGTHRQKGIGSQLLEYLSPTFVFSKSDQSSGDPGPFYEKRNYVKTRSRQSKSRLDIDKIRPNRKKNIDVYQKRTRGLRQTSIRRLQE